jgi:hypothetical protein
MGNGGGPGGFSGGRVFDLAGGHGPLAHVMLLLTIRRPARSSSTRRCRRHMSRC